MTIKYGKGKRTKKNFMPIGYVAYNTDQFYYERACYWFLDSKDQENYEEYRPAHRSQSLRAILRRLKRFHYPKGTRIVFPNWFIGYASVMIII